MRSSHPSAPVRLEWSSDSEPGITRRRQGRGFAYAGPNGAALRPAEVERIRALAIPPAWSDVWIAPRPTAHIQATGRDARGRKQYIYHPEWRLAQESNKFARMHAFGLALPGIRAAVGKDVRGSSVDFQRVVAGAVRLLDHAPIRVGNDEYAHQNGTYGLTTLRHRHVQVDGNELVIRFAGKGGKVQSLSIRDAKVARVVKACEELPGQELFQYTAECGEVRRVRSNDINEYLRGVSGGDFTAKDFRTWAASVVALGVLTELTPPATRAESRAAARAAVQEACSLLGNTPTICRKSYIHPVVFSALEDGRLAQTWARNSARWNASGRDPHEQLFLCLLRHERAAGEGSRTSGSSQKPAARRRRPVR